MAATYTIQPLSIPAIFEALVSEVSTNLASATIPQVSFRHGTWLDILKELTVDSNSPTEAVKNGKYPLVCLIHQFDEKPFDSISETTNLTLIIVTNSTIDATTDARYTDNFIPILYPIYAELKQVIADSMYFLGYNQNFSHIKRDLTHAGQSGEDGNTAYKLPDVLDGLLMTNIDLKVNLDPICDAPERNVCLLTDCPNGREAYFQNIFKNVTFSGLNTDTITASVNDFYFLDASGGLPAPFEPEIDWQGDGTYVAMAGSGVGPFTASFDVTTGYGAGFYTGVIKFGDAYVTFYFKVKDGLVSKMTTLISQDWDIDLECSNYPNYPITIDTTHTMELYNPEVIPVGQEELPIMVGYELVIFNVTKDTDTFSAVLTYTASTTTTTAYAGNYNIDNKFSYGGQSPLTQRSIIKTRCITL